jgi:hypothetical protein
MYATHGTAFAIMFWCVACILFAQGGVVLRGNIGRSSLALPPVVAEKEAEEDFRKAEADAEYAKAQWQNAEAKAEAAEGRVEETMSSAHAKWMHAKYWVTHHEGEIALILTVVLTIILLIGCYLSGLSEDFEHMWHVFYGFSYQGKKNIIGLVLFLIGGTVIFWHLGIIQNYLEQIGMCAFLGLAVIGILFVLAREASRPALAAAAEAKEVIHHMYDAIDDVLDFLGLSDDSSDSSGTTRCCQGLRKKFSKAKDEQAKPSRPTRKTQRRKERKVKTLGKSRMSRLFG